MTIYEFRDALISAMKSAPIPDGVRTEKDFETAFLIPIVQQMSANEKDVHLYCHPWGSKARCQPDCHAARANGQAVVGCPRCWAESKKWASVLAFGTNHTFDLVAKDVSGRTLAVETKFLTAKGKRMPNGEIQRMSASVPLLKPNTITLLGYAVFGGVLMRDGTKTPRRPKPGSRGADICLIFRTVL